MSRLRRCLIAFLVASTALFAAGAIAERFTADSHAEPASTHLSESAGEEGSARDEAAPGSDEQSHAGESETVLGMDVESTPLVVIAVVFGLGLAWLVATRAGEMPAFLAALTPVVLAWAA